jgi:hypothetical protein
VAEVAGLSKSGGGRVHDDVREISAVVERSKD